MATMFVISLNSPPALGFHAKVKRMEQKKQLLPKVSRGRQIGVSLPRRICYHGCFYAPHLLYHLEFIGM